MNDTRTPFSVKRLLALLTMLCLSTLLAACGGGGAKGEGGGSVVPVDPYPPGSGLSPYVTLRILNGASATNTLPIGAVRTISAAVVNSAGAPVPNVVVTFTAPADLARLNPAIGTALTDANGVASLGLEGLAVGAGTLTAAVTVESFERKVNLNFSVVPDTSPQAGTITFKTASVQTLKLGGTIGESTSVLSFQVVNQLGAADGRVGCQWHGQHGGQRGHGAYAGARDGVDERRGDGLFGAVDPAVGQLG